MEKLKRSALAKFIAVLLASVSLISAAFYSVMCLFMLLEDWYSMKREEVIELARADAAEAVSYKVAVAVKDEIGERDISFDESGKPIYPNDPAGLEPLASIYDRLTGNSNWRFRVSVGGNVIADSLAQTKNDRELYLSRTYREKYTLVWYYEDRDFSDGADLQYSDGIKLHVLETPALPTITMNGEEAGRIDIEVEILVHKETMLYDDQFSAEIDFAKFMYGMRYAGICIAAISAAVFLLCYIFVIAAAGHKRAAEGVSLSRFDKLPFDILLAASVAICTLFAALFIEINEQIATEFGVHAYAAKYSAPLNHALGALLCLVTVLAAAIFVTVTMTFASRMKSRAFIKYNAVTFICRMLKSALKAAFRFLRRVFMAIPYIWRTLAVSLAFSVISLLVVIMSWSSEEFILLLMLLFALAIFDVCYGAYCMHKLREAAQKLASGDLLHRVDKRGLYGEYGLHADDLDRIGDGMAAAVEERMKSERFRTELITNVSHDIKTPLTSIINYVDLLRSCDIKDETALSYLDILDKHSQKLRHLTEDLIEASKASSGTLPVELSPTDLSVLVSQTAGEYEERLGAAGLTLVVRRRGDAENAVVMADGRHTARIMDNLMSNVVKYSLPGTRVYLELFTDKDSAEITLSNISRDPVGAAGDELTERFVRGDESRHTEGSGLGLSIAKSLAEIQNASLTVSVEADLFRVRLRFGKNGQEQ